MDISDFRLYTIAFECRFAPALLHWDRAGSIWSQVSGKHPGIKLIKGEPNQTAFRIQDRFELRVALGQFNVNGYNPGTAADEFISLADDFSSTVVRQVGIETFTRVGLRPIFIKEYPTREAASAPLLSLGLLRLPEGPCFGIAGEPILPIYGLRWESDMKGCVINISVVEREYEFEPPFAWEGVEPKKVKKTALNIDVDYYTVAAVEVSRLGFAEWIKQALHVVRRDANRFLESKACPL